VDYLNHNQANFHNSSLKDKLKAVGFLEDKPHLLEVEVSLVGKVMLSNHLCKKHKHQGVYLEVVD